MRTFLKPDRYYSKLRRWSDPSRMRDERDGSIWPAFDTGYRHQPK